MPPFRRTAAIVFGREELHVEGFHAQDGVAHLGQVAQQLLGILGADGLVSDHVGEVLNTVHLQDGGIQTLAHLILQQLMKTVKGQLMKHPFETFEIMTPDGTIRLTSEDCAMLLSGEMQEVVINNCHYCAFELLDQEVLKMQTDIFDDNLIRMKTGGYDQPDFEMTM